MTDPKMRNATGQGGESGEAAKQIIQRQYSSKSTATEAQRVRILDALRISPKTTYDLRRMGCYQAPARIIELRRMGYDIETELVALYDRDGYLHPRCARYHLRGEPLEGLQ